MLSKKIELIPDLITDCDGVCLDFHSSFDTYMNQEAGIKKQSKTFKCYQFSDSYPQLNNIEKYIKDFLLTPYYVRNMKPYDNVLDALTLIKQSGKKITLLTSCGTNPITTNARIDCFDKELPGLIDDFVFLPIGDNKQKHLSKSEKSIVVDDLIGVCNVANNHFHTPRLMSRDHNGEELATGKIKRISSFLDLDYFD